PWSYPPYCAEDSSTKAKFCVYTSSDYNNGHGVSFIAAPSTEDDILSMVSNASLAERGRRHLAPAEDLGYAVREVPDKGRGVFAQHPIQKGSVFLIGFPAVVIAQEFELGTFPGISEEARHRLYDLAFRQLPFAERVTTLAHSSDEDLYEDVVRKNGFGAKIGGRPYSGVFPEIDMMNHGCQPNTVVRFSASTLSVEATAVRDIAIGEELTISCE
ncbi:hypothetical protein B0T14DRAFT_403552, partial [Immersiella caudata]